MSRPLAAYLGIFLSFLLIGCASESPSKTPSEANGETTAAAKGLTPVMSDQQGSEDLTRLDRLWKERENDISTSDYPLGPGDVLGINVPDMDELKDTTARINGNGDLTLPTVGTLHAAGMTETELESELRTRLRKYLVDPQFSLFVKQYHSRQVAVVGAVAKPGLYDLTSTKDTVLDVLSQAGGRTNDAAQRILLLPAERRTTQTGEGRSLPSTTAGKTSPTLEQMVTGNNVGEVVSHNDPIVLDLRSLDRGSTQKYLSLSARPGDVVFVPDAGEVFVQGWVNKPGDYKITPGLTVKGAVGAAGGPLFAADSGGVRVIRVARNGEQVTFPVDLETTDMVVQEGDLIDVPYSTAKIVPYGVASFVSRMGVGASLAAF